MNRAINLHLDRLALMTSAVAWFEGMAKENIMHELIQEQESFYAD